MNASRTFPTHARLEHLRVRVSKLLQAEHATPSEGVPVLIELVYHALKNVGENDKAESYRNFVAELFEIKEVIIPTGTEPL